MEHLPRWTQGWSWIVHNLHQGAIIALGWGQKAIHETASRPCMCFCFHFCIRKHDIILMKLQLCSCCFLNFYGCCPLSVSYLALCFMIRYNQINLPSFAWPGVAWTMLGEGSSILSDSARENSSSLVASGHALNSRSFLLDSGTSKKETSEMDQML